jgi:hypothetical protein
MEPPTPHHASRDLYWITGYLNDREQAPDVIRKPLSLHDALPCFHKSVLDPTRTTLGSQRRVFTQLEVQVSLQAQLQYKQLR